MPETKGKYDYGIIAIGSGSAGGSAAFVAKRCNTKVAVVEERRDMLGGHCPNYACVPTKALLKSAHIYNLAKKAQEFGVRAENVSFDFEKVAEYRESIVSQLTGSRIEKNLASAGIDLLWGQAQFVSEHELMVAGRRYSAAHIVISSGSKEFIPPIKGLGEAGFWTSDEAVKLTKLPESIIIIGAGPVGTEFAQIFSSFGVKVTLLQRGPQILQRDEPEAAKLVQENLESRGVSVITDMEVLEVMKKGNDKLARVEVSQGEKTYRAQELMVATGRRANLLPLNLEKAGVRVDEKGRLELNEFLQTNISNIWAAGDAAGAWQFTHTAAYEGDLVGRNICQEAHEATDYSVVPRVTFCEPEVASVGDTEAQADAAGRDIRVGKFNVGGLGRYLIEKDSRGFVKIIADKKTGRIYGGTAVGINAGQLIHEVALAMKAKLPAAEIGRMIHAYPTFSEAVAAAGEQFID